MKKFFCTMLTASLFAGTLSAQNPEPLPLYPEGATESNGLSPEKVVETPQSLVGAVEADYFIFPADPKTATGQAVVICPGGGYASVAYSHEGIQVAQWLNGQGVTALVLRYRMPNGHDQIPLKDAQTALKLMRQNAQKWHVDPNQVGIMGFSAGGHLAATASTHFTDSTDRPDFSILIYPVISFDPTFTHMGTRNNLIGQKDDESLIEYYSNEKQVTDQTPRAFIALSDDDPGVPPENSIRYYSALKQHGIPAELHIYPSGGHGWGWRDSFKYHDELLRSLSRWLTEIRK